VSQTRHLEIDRDDLAATLRELPADVSRIEIGEGKERIVVADARPVRKCGGCTLCCTVAGINELDKPPMTPCRHLKGHGCGIYPNRPGTCSSFACGWLLGNFDERFRPDKIGAYVAFFMTEKFGFYAVVQIDSRLLHRKRLRQMIAHLAYLPEIRVVYDDKHGVILRQGERPVRFKVMARPPGDHEVLAYLPESIG
jgi:hypothetical protein